MKCFLWVTFFICLSAFSVAWSQTNFTIGTYNLEKFIADDTQDFADKKDKIAESIAAMNVDVLGLVEMGNRDSLNILLETLEQKNVHYAYQHWMASNDKSLNLTLLSRYPLTNIVHHNRDRYSLGGKSYSMKRGILEATVRVTPKYSFTVLLTHLKSQMESKIVDQNEVRRKEAEVLRQKVDEILQKDEKADFVVMGDFNDDYNMPPIREIRGTKTGKIRLVDARPVEQIGDSVPESRTRGKYRSVAWTHFYNTEDKYSRLDYIMYSPGLKKQFLPDLTRVVVVPNWGVGSDHRPIRAGFCVEK